MNQYTRYNITAGGGTLNNYNAAFGGIYSDIQVYAASPVSLGSSFSISPTAPTVPFEFKVRWDAEVTVNGFTVTICGVTIAQDCLNQPGQFTCYWDTAAWQIQYQPSGIERPQEYAGVENRTVPTSGTLPLTAGVDKAYQRLVGGPTTLLGNYTVSANTGATDGSQFIVEIGPNTTIGANDFRVFGLLIPEAIALSGNAFVIATYDATNTVWRAALANKAVTLANISKQGALTVLVNATNASADVAALPFSVDGGVLQRSGTSLVAEKITQSNFDEGSSVNTIGSVGIGSAAILNLNGSPQTALAAPAAGDFNIPLGFLVTSAIGSPNTAYAGGTTLEFYCNGCTMVLATATDILSFTTACTTWVPLAQPTGDTGNLIAGQAILVRAQGTNPTTGTGSITIEPVYAQKIQPAP
jgi:hypothetical protein